MRRLRCFAVVALAVGLGAIAPTAGAGRAAGRSAIDGIYRVQTTLAELRKVAGPGDQDPANFGRFTAVFDRGRFVITQQNGEVCTWQYGTFTLAGNRLRLSFLDGGGVGTNAYNKAGERLVFAYTPSRGALRLKATPGGPPPPSLMKPWPLVSKTPRWVWTAGARCAPPRKALPQ